ncbi:MAG: small-conductance mechanosensitive channel [Kiritimatiellia bacterium]|jgi:small-conductance mechanosensitive channel
MNNFELGAWLMVHMDKVVKAGLLLLIGLPLVRILAGFVRRVIKRHTTAQSGMVTYKVIWYGGLFIITIMVMRELGFKLTTLLGAAGVAGVAIGFAAQTSLSNVISGLFLLGERPFEVGDLLQVGATTGTVTSIDMLSCKLRTHDNKYVRIPNEHLVKNEFTNVTRYPIRRYDISLGVAYKEDVSEVIKLLKSVADKNPYSLDEPEPVILFTGFGESSLNLLVGIWFSKDDFIMLRNSINHEIKEAFDAAGIEIPFPHRTLFVGSNTAPFPVRIVEPGGAE